MKHMANCDMDDFAAAATRARPVFAAWVEKVGARDPRAVLGERLGVEAALSPGEQAGLVEAVFGELLWDALERAPELTRELLCAVTFTEPEDFGARAFSEYVRAAREMYCDDAVRLFFTFCASRSRGTGFGR